MSAGVSPTTGVRSFRSSSFQEQIMDVALKVGDKIRVTWQAGRTGEAYAYVKGCFVFRRKSEWLVPPKAGSTWDVEIVFHQRGNIFHAVGIKEIQKPVWIGGFHDVVFRMIDGCPIARLRGRRAVPCRMQWRDRSPEDNELWRVTIVYASEDIVFVRPILFTRIEPIFSVVPVEANGDTTGQISHRVRFEEVDYRMITQIGGRISFPCDIRWAQKWPEQGETWEVVTVDTNKTETINFLAPIRLIPEEQPMLLEGDKPSTATGV